MMHKEELLGVQLRFDGRYRELLVKLKERGCEILRLQN
jgi:hypothetical protein